MLKRIIALLVLTLYLHGMSGYTMSIHTCSVTGFQDVYTGYNLEDPCGMDENNCQETSPHFEQADCCDVQETIVNVDDDSNISDFKTQLTIQFVKQIFVHTYSFSHHIPALHFYLDLYPIRPPKPCIICIFKI